MRSLQPFGRERFAGHHLGRAEHSQPAAERLQHRSPRDRTEWIRQIVVIQFQSTNKNSLLPSSAWAYCCQAASVAGISIGRKELR